jgi:hypothetical protein
MAIQEFRPELISRRGELIAWGSALLVGGAWFVLRHSAGFASRLVPILAVPLLIAALSISLGNWMDRHTQLRLDPQGVSFTNGLRHVQLKWEQIQQVRVMPAAWGKKIQVFGERAYFAFFTLGEVKAQGRVLGRTGIAAGEFALQRILESAHLHEVHSLSPDQGQEGNYYVRS